MGFVLSCNVKGCGKSQEPLLDKITEDVYCSECGGIISGVTHFAKNAMKTMGQFKRTIAGQKPFCIKCNGCGKSEQPKLINDKLICPLCIREHDTVPPVYAHSVKEFIKKNSPPKGADQK